MWVQDAPSWPNLQVPKSAMKSERFFFGICESAQERGCKPTRLADIHILNYVPYMKRNAFRIQLSSIESICLVWINPNSEGFHVCPRCIWGSGHGQNQAAPGAAEGVESSYMRSGNTWYHLGFVYEMILDTWYCHYTALRGNPYSQAENWDSDSSPSFLSKKSLDWDATIQRGKSHKQWSTGYL